MLLDDNVATLLDETFDDFDPRELPPVTILEGE